MARDREDRRTSIPSRWSGSWGALYISGGFADLFFERGSVSSLPLEERVANSLGWLIEGGRLGATARLSPGTVPPS